MEQAAVSEMVPLELEVLFSLATARSAVASLHHHCLRGCTSVPSATTETGPSWFDTDLDAWTCRCREGMDGCGTATYIINSLYLVY